MVPIDIQVKDKVKPDIYVDEGDIKCFTNMNC